MATKITLKIDLDVSGKIEEEQIVSAVKSGLLASLSDLEHNVLRRSSLSIQLTHLNGRPFKKYSMPDPFELREESE
jgi:hypothetical protein